jgi:hypothetical protein
VAKKKYTKSWRQSTARVLLPDAVTCIGIPGEMVLVHPSTGEMAIFYPHPATVLCCDGDGREMFLLRPGRDAGPPTKKDVAVAVEDLYERFTHRESDGHYNAICKPFRKPIYRGQISVVRYRAVKDLDEDSEGEMIEWEHYFEAPDYAELWFVGGDQYYIPRGNWRVDADGIEHYNG